MLGNPRCPITHQQAMSQLSHAIEVTGTSRARQLVNCLFVAAFSVVPRRAQRGRQLGSATSRS